MVEGRCKISLWISPSRSRPSTELHRYCHDSSLWGCWMNVSSNIAATISSKLHFCVCKIFSLGAITLYTLHKCSGVSFTYLMLSSFLTSTNPGSLTYIGQCAGPTVAGLTAHVTYSANHDVSFGCCTHESRSHVAFQKLFVLGSFLEVYDNNIVT